MWSINAYGCFSIVKKPQDPEEILTIRARVKQDLLNLEKFYPEVVEEGIIIETFFSDYPFRIKMSQLDWATVMARMVIDIDYSNFKDTVADRQGKERAKVYSSVWADLIDLEDLEPLLDDNTWNNRYVNSYVSVKNTDKLDDRDDYLGYSDTDMYDEGPNFHFILD